MNTTTTPATPDQPLTAILGEGKAIHLTDGEGGVLCNRYQSVGGSWKPVTILGGHWTLATCKRCHKARQHAAL